MLKVSHWAPTDFTFRDDCERPWIAEIAWDRHRALLELWRHNPDGLLSLPVPEHVPTNSELYVEPDVLRSSEVMSALLRECACMAGELGAETIPLPCPSELGLDVDGVDIVDRAFAFTWFRKRLNAGI